MCVRNDQPPPPAVTSKHWGEMGRSAGAWDFAASGPCWRLSFVGFASENTASSSLGCLRLSEFANKSFNVFQPFRIPNPPFAAALSLLLVSWLVGCKTGHAIRALGNFPLWHGALHARMVSSWLQDRCNNRLQTKPASWYFWFFAGFNHWLSQEPKLEVPTISKA